jgi:hypothetical protein
MEYAYKRVTYIQVQAQDPTKEVVVFFAVRPYNLEEGKIVDAPISEEVTHTMVLPEGEGSLFQQAQAYLLNLLGN